MARTSTLTYFTSKSRSRPIVDNGTARLSPSFSTSSFANKVNMMFFGTSFQDHGMLFLAHVNVDVSDGFSYSFPNFASKA